MRVEVEVVRCDGQPYMPGEAIVRVNGEDIARLRSGESVVICTEERYWTKVDQPHDREIAAARAAGGLSSGQEAK